MRLSEKVTIITGAGSGIGRATALRFAHEGASVMVVDKIAERARTVAEEIQVKGGKSQAFTADVSKSPEVQMLMAATLKTFGRIDILVNNAGYGIAGSVVDTAEDDWDALMSVNVKGVFLCCKYAIPTMIEQGHGVIINTASAVSVVGIANRAAYVASKGAVAALTRALAMDHVTDNIRVNCLGVGTVDSPYYTKLMAESDDAEGLMAGLKQRQLLGRLGSPEEIAAAMVFLASDEASFCVGSTLFVDGGWTAY